MKMSTAYDEVIMYEHYEIAEKNGISKENVYQRVKHYGWTIERAITTPIATQWLGKYKGFHKIALKNGISLNVFYARMRKGWKLEDAATKLSGTNRK